MIAVIAGTGHLPVLACQKLVAQDKPFFVITLFQENNVADMRAAVGDHAEVIAQDFYKPGAILDYLKERHTTHVLFIGKVDKQNLLKHLKYDWLALKLLGTVVTRSDKNIMETLLAELARHNIVTLRQDEVLGSLRVPPGVLCGTVSDGLRHDIHLGIKTAITMSQADIGQTVVVKNGMILAVEAIEGTDACVKRGLSLGGNGIVICKAARFDQNTKFDLPTLGPASLEAFSVGDVACVAWLSSHTLIAQQELFIQKAMSLGITLVSVGNDEL
jgi:DUF1009 family protein